MKLLTKEAREGLIAAGKGPEPSTEKPRAVLAKFFDPTGSWTWYATEGEERGEDFIFFGYVDGFEGEWGYWSLNELESVKGPLGLGIERDLHFSDMAITFEGEVVKA